MNNNFCFNISKWGKNIGGEENEESFDFECSICGAELTSDDMGYSPLRVEGEPTAIVFCPYCGEEVF